MTMQISDLCVELGIDYTFPLQPIAIQNMGVATNMLTTQQHQAVSDGALKTSAENATVPVLADLM
jgi:hypothetical protein